MTTASIRPTDAAVIAGVVKGSVASCQNSFGRYNLNALVRDIKQYLEGRDEITMELHESTYLTSLMQKYASDPSDWTSYFHNDPSKAYTRNTISNISHKANILLLVWNPGKGSPVHDHANAHCVMKVLAGELQETLYEMPNTAPTDPKPLTAKSSTVHGIDDVTYISDTIGLHRIHNPNSERIAVSLHLYTPPNAADYGYNIFDEATGRSSHVPKAHAN